MKKLRIIYSGPRQDPWRIEVPKSWPVVRDCPTGLQYEVQTRCLFSDCQYRLLAEEIIDKMKYLWERQYQIAALAQQSNTRLFRDVYGGRESARILLDCPPAVLRLNDASKFQQCRRFNGPCPFCWARRVKHIFEQAARVLFGKMPRDREDQLKLKNKKLFLLEQHEHLDVPPMLANYPLPELDGVESRKVFTDKLTKQKLNDHLWGMSSIITIEYCTAEGCKVWVRRLALMIKPFKTLSGKHEIELPAIPNTENVRRKIDRTGEVTYKTHEPPLTMQKLTDIVGSVFRYPYRDLSVEEMMPVLERFALMRTKHQRMRLLSSTGVLGPNKLLRSVLLNRKEP